MSVILEKGETMKTAPQNIKKKALQLEKALDRVATLANEIEAWAEKNGAEPCEFFRDNRLDMAYEFDLSYLLENLDKVARGEVDEWPQY